MRIKNNVNGITLIALVITIIVLLILAGITISSLFGEGGLLKQSETASNETEKQEATEAMNLKITEAQITSYEKNKEWPTLQYLADSLCEDTEMEYVLLESQKTASTQEHLPQIDVNQGRGSIFTKITRYPYEFEINSSLQIVGIDGIKIADDTEGETGDHISTIIDDFSPEIIKINGTYITVKIPENILAKSKSYAYLLNEEVIEVSNESEYSFINLNLETEYTISVIATDELDKIKESDPIKVTTLNELYLYKEGDECTPVTGGWTCSKENSAVYFAIGENRMYASSGTKEYRMFKLLPKNAINLSAYSTITFDLIYSYNWHSSWPVRAGYDVQATWGWSGSSNYVILGTSSNRQTVTVDLTNANDELYIGVGGNGEITLYNVFLSK